MTTYCFDFTKQDIRLIKRVLYDAILDAEATLPRCSSYFGEKDLNRLFKYISDLKSFRDRFNLNANSLEQLPF